MGGLAGSGTASADDGVSVAVSNTSCWDDSATITVSWNAMGTGQQYADYTYGGSFQSGTFYGTGPMPEWQTTVTITGLAPGSMVTIRVNTTTSSGWTSSKVITVTAPMCNTVVVTQPQVVFPVIIPTRPIFVPVFRPRPPFPPQAPMPFPPFLPPIPPGFPIPPPMYPIQPFPMPYY